VEHLGELLQLAGGQDQDLVSLIERVATGDQSALAALYDAMNQLIYSLVLRVLGDVTSSSFPLGGKLTIASMKRRGLHLIERVPHCAATWN